MRTIRNDHLIENIEGASLSLGAIAFSVILAAASFKMEDIGTFEETVGNTILVVLDGLLVGISVLVIARRVLYFTCGKRVTRSAFPEGLL